MISSAWGDPELSDLDILLYVKDTTGERDTAETKRNERSIPVHKVILAASSKYFEAKIKRWMNDQPASGPADGMESLSEEISKLSTAHVKPMLKVACSSPEEQDAGEACLRTMYLQNCPLDGEVASLDPDKSISFLVQVARWGDEWQSECIARHCQAGLATLTEAKAFCARHVNMLFEEMPSYLRGAEVRGVVADACSRWLLKNFEDVHVVVTNEGKRAAFCELCPEAVILWAGMDNLCAASENDVAIALAYWASGEQGCRCEKGVLKRLSLSLRVSKLTKTFRFLVLPRLPFFTEHEELNCLNLGECAPLPCYNENIIPYYKKHMSAWYEKYARMGILSEGSGDSRYTCTWKIPQAVLRQNFREEGVYEGPLLYIKGFLLRLTCQVDIDIDNQDFYLRVWIFPEGSAVIPGPEFVAVALKLVQASVVAQVSEQQKVEDIMVPTYYGKDFVRNFRCGKFNISDVINLGDGLEAECIITISVYDVE
ncbi:hypothetical protein DUNSADRAFT_4822 [Dunaliella salina]|uniref:BTB domain-containing protein n=1 Tax=Dunaliella salina TaxID=3046 RepID=A0ABQ7GR58_DUNSA|nr:hypothetical protein DUNSADRAFT_4822 [Dunaliella salina]|eukprot:KAF5837099.1 hypothetical protein DUNSADRAFT_4822 [Dunaliella salina]